MLAHAEDQCQGPRRDRARGQRVLHDAPDEFGHRACIVDPRHAAIGQRRYPPVDHDLANGWHFQAAYNRSSKTRGGYDVAAYYGAPDRDGIGVYINPSYSHADTTQDGEAVSLPKRAQPLPKPPPEKAGATLTLVVPVEFFFR